LWERAVEVFWTPKIGDRERHTWFREGSLKLGKADL